MLNFCKVDGTIIKTYSITERGTSNLDYSFTKYWYGVDKDGNKEKYAIYPVNQYYGSGANRVHIVGSDNKEYFIDRLMYKTYNGFTISVSCSSGVKNGCNRPISFTATVSCNSPKSNANASYNESDSPVRLLTDITYTISDNGSSTSKTFYNASTSSTVSSRPTGNVVFNYSTYFDTTSKTIEFPDSTSVTFTGTYRCTDPSKIVYCGMTETFNGPFRIKITDGSTTKTYTSNGNWTGYVTSSYIYLISGGGGSGES